MSTLNTSKLDFLAHTLRQIVAGQIEPRRQRLVRQALSRLDSDAYGYCQECGIDIPYRDLEQQPERRCCSRCESNKER